MKRILLTWSVLALLTDAPAQTSTQDQPNTAAISGVVADVNSRQPIEAAVVTLSAVGLGTQRTQRTDQKGRFVFADIAAGVYVLSAAKAGYSSARLGGSAMASAGQVVLHAGQWFRDARIDLTKLAGLGGRVVDETNAAVVGAYIRLLRPFQLNGSTQLAAGPVTKTDDRGEYRFGNLSPGSYFVSLPIVQHAVSAGATQADIEGLPANRMSGLTNTEAILLQRGQASTKLNGGVIIDGRSAVVLGNYPVAPPTVGDRSGAYTTTFYPSSPSINGAMTVTVGSGEERSGIDMTLRAVPAVHVCGRLEASPDAVKGFSLRLMPRGLEALGVGSEAATTLVESDGTFCFPRVPTGEYTIVAPGATFEFLLDSPNLLVDLPLQVALPKTPGVMRSGAAASGVEVAAAPAIRYATSVSSAIADDHAGFVRFDLSVGEADIDGLMLPLELSGAIEGTVVLQDATEDTTIGSAEIAPLNGDPGMGARFAPSKTGRFFARVLRPGNYVIRFPTADLTLVSIAANGEDVSRRSIPVHSGSTTTVTVRLSGKPTVLSGTIQDEHGRAISGAVVILFPIDRSLWRNYGFTPTWIRTAVSADGAYRISRVRPGEYYVIGVAAEDGGKWADPTFLAGASASAARVTIPLGSNKTQDVVVLKK